MVTGSEATADYRVQIWTPSYLLSGLPRPVIASASPLIIPGSRFPIQWSGIDTIDRVVISKMPGVTHSTHMDQRQLVLACTAVNSGATAGTTTCQAPPDFTVAPPGQYILFIMRNGVPSVGQVPPPPPPPPPTDEFTHGYAHLRLLTSMHTCKHMIGMIRLRGTITAFLPLPSMAWRHALEPFSRKIACRAQSASRLRVP